jgi:hypothetical protein
MEKADAPASLVASSSSRSVDCPPGMPNCMPAPLPVSIIATDASIAPGPILSAGRGTTTLSPRTPYNDVLIAETGSEFASLRNARYTTWPYPGEIRFKEVYLVLPDAYEPIFPGYSNEQFLVTSDGEKQVKLYLKQQGSATLGADADIYVQSPIATDEADHPLASVETSNTGAIYSLVKRGEEVLIEVNFRPTTGVAQDAIASARAELSRAIERIELEW